MKTYWMVVLGLALADAAIVAVVLLNDGGPENLVWWAFLIIPLAIVVLILVGLVLQVIR